MADLPKVKQEFEADTRDYSGPLREAARQVDKFADKNTEAALAARKMGVAAKEAADKAARAQRDAAEAAKQLARGELSADEAANAAARATREVERASIKAAEAQRATARAAEDAAQQYRQEARDAALAGAAQKLAALKAAGATREHNAEVLRLRKEMPELEKASGDAFKLMSSGTRTFGNALGSASAGMEELTGLGRAMPGVIIAGVQLLPAVFAAAGGAITLGLGGAIAGVGLLAASKNKEIRAEWGSLGKEVFSGLQRDAQPFVATLEHIGQYAEDEFRSWRPLVRGAFKELAPEVDAFSQEAISSLDELKPAFNSIVTGFGVQLRGLGPQLAPSLHNISVGVEAIGDAAAKNPEALGEMAHDLSLVVRAGGDVIGFFTRYEGQIMRVIEVTNAWAAGPLGTVALEMYKLKNLMGGLGADKAAEMLVDFGGAAGTAAGATTQTGVATEKLKTAEQLAAMSTDQLKAALDRLTGANQSAFDAETAYRQALMAAEAQGKKNNAGIDRSTAAATANRAVLSNLAKEIKNVEANSHPTAAAIEEMRRRFISAAENMNVSRAEARRLADQLLGVRDAANKIPSTKNTKLSSNAAAQKRAIQDYQNKINSLHGKTVDIFTVMHLTETQAYKNKRDNFNLKAGGGLVHRAEGGPVGLAAGGGPSGYVRGPGTTTSDSIPALLSDKEYVINAEQTAKYRPLLDAINYKLDGFKAGGGLASVWTPVAGAIGDPLSRAERAAARVAHARARPEYLASMAAQQALAAMRRSVYGGINRGGMPSGPQGTVVQHVTHVHVAGSVWEFSKLTQAIAGELIRNRIPVTQPAGRL